MSMLRQDARLNGYASPPPPSPWSAMSLKSVLTTVVAGSHYLIHPQVLGTIEETIKPDVIIPVTVLEPDQLYNHLEDTLRLFDLYDDVFNPEFGSVLIEKPGAKAAMAAMSAGNGKSVMHLREDAKDPRSPRDTTTASATKSSVSDMPPGPYILHGANVHQAWRMYNDTMDAFAWAVYPDKVDENDVFNVLRLPADSASNHKLVPVPSRLYGTLPPEKAPLRGFRFTVPDCMSLRGVPTSISSASWRHLHNDTAADTTAALVKRLVDLGAVIVGKTKSSQFGSGREWKDEVAPKNPREDGHQDAAAGSTGAGSAVAGYDWLKASIGIDAIGQALETAAAHGLFALRTSPGRVPLDGAQISPLKSNAMSIFGADLSELFRDATAIVHQSLSSPPIAFPRRIISVSDLEGTNNRYAGKHKEFVAAAESLLGVKSQRISLQEMWKSKPPVEAKGQTLQRYMRNACLSPSAPFFSFCYDFYHQYDVFRNEYQTAFGRQPTVEATVLHQWSLGKNVSEAEYADYQARIAVFRTWFGQRIMPLDEKSDAVLIMPYASVAPRYTAPMPETKHGVTAQLLGSLLGAPQVLAPFAQFPYRSKISHQTEYHPVYAALLGASGSDTMLVKLVEATFQQARSFGPHPDGNWSPLGHPATANETTDASRGPEPNGNWSPLKKNKKNAPRRAPHDNTDGLRTNGSGSADHPATADGTTDASHEPESDGDWSLLGNWSPLDDPATAKEAPAPRSVETKPRQ
ncbi:hypothetical protein E4U53_008085 [Claviceps sorghi]|nr:hypothetical protein E4U53_008085 [Claviceps sorghi]